MDTEAIALELPTLVDTEAPRRELVAFLSLGTLVVWSFAAFSTLHAMVI